MIKLLGQGFCNCIGCTASGIPRAQSLYVWWHHLVGGVQAKMDNRRSCLIQAACRQPYQAHGRVTRVRQPRVTGSIQVKFSLWSKYGRVNIELWSNQIKSNQKQVNYGQAAGRSTASFVLGQSWSEPVMCRKVF